MKKSLLYAALLCAGIYAASCSDSEGGGRAPEPAPEYFRIAFDSPALAAELNTDFTTFCKKYAKYTADPGANAFSARPSSVAPGMDMPQPPPVFYLGSYLKTPTDSILLTLLAEKDNYGKVGIVRAVPENTDKHLDVWTYCLTASETLRLGTFLGTKYKSPSSSGVFQTIDDTLNHIAQHGTAETLACTIFGVVPQTAYAVFQLDNGAFSAQLMNSYLKLDYPAMRRWLGGDHAAFASSHYILGNKINAFGDLYVYFDYAKDADGNTFTVDVHADKNGGKISEIDVYVSAERNDADKQLSVWKEYARDYATKGLGAFKEAYTTDSWGEKKETFADLAAAIAHVEANGRPGAFDGGIIVVFETDGVATNLVMNQQYIYLLIKDPNYNVE